jgi:hypothetical protein
VCQGRGQRRPSRPSIDLLKRAGSSPSRVTSVAVGFAMYGRSLIPAQLLMAPEASGYGLGLSMVQAGLVVAPSGLLMYLCSGVGARISAARGPRTSLGVGIVVVGLGYVSALGLRDQWWEISLATALIGAGIGIAYAAMPALIMGAVPITETAAANGLNALMRSVGTSLSSAVVSVVLAHQRMRLGDVVLPSAHGFTLALLISIGAAALAFSLSRAIPRQPRAVVLREVSAPEALEPATT